MKENMSKEDEIAYKRHIENTRVELSVIETAEFKAVRKNLIEVAKALLETGSSKEFIVTVTSKYLSLEDIDAIERGEDPDRNTDDDE